MSTKYDAIIIGGGHNGLTAACTLAQAGRKVALFERQAELGGLAGSHEFHAGFRTGGLLTDTSTFRSEVVNALELSRFGLVHEQGRPDIFIPDQNNRGICLYADTLNAAEEIARYDEREATAYVNYRTFLERIQKFMNELFVGLPADVDHLDRGQFITLLKKGLRLRRLGKKDMMEVMRINLMCVADWLNEWFQMNLLKSALAAPAIYGSFTGPWSPGTNANLVLHECVSGNRVQGGAPGLISALTRACQAHGVAINTNTPVAVIDIANSRVRGVVLENGTAVTAPLVLASCHPKRTLGELIDKRLLSLASEHAIANYRDRGTTAVVNLALKQPLSYTCRPNLRPAITRIAGKDLDCLEKSFDAVKYRSISERPILEIHDPTVDGSGSAPEGGAVASIMVHFAPYDLAAGWDDEQRRLLGDRVEAILAEFAPGVSDAVIAREVLAPPDLEARYGLNNGHIYHGEHALDQLLVRPTRECAGYATPFAGLFLCGSGTPPGGGLTGLPGLLAAKRALAK